MTVARGRGGVRIAAALLALAAAGVQAGVLRHCDAPPELDAARQDRLLRFAAIVKTELDRSGHGMALIARSGLDLGRFGLRYSHAGISLQASPNAPWSVRQLYYDCDLRRPRLFDQGMAGFVLGSVAAARSYVSVLLLPPAAEAPLAAAVTDNRRALQLLGGSYSANAYAWGQQHQNCNQWVAEMLALAWGGLDDGDAPRAAAQQWLHERGYTPVRFDVGNPLLRWFGAALPWLHDDDHPQADLEQAVYRVSMPASIESFVFDRVPGARRIEFCHDERHVVVRRGWLPLADGCRPGGDDTVIAFD